MEFESKLVPVLRESIGIVRMILFKKLKTHLAQKHPAKEDGYINKLSGAVVNELFGTPNTLEPFATFTRENRDAIESELTSIAEDFEAFRIPLTDAIRVQFLCDSQEGIDSQSILAKAQSLGILIVDRDIPLPNTFMNTVHTLGVAHNLIAPRSEGDKPTTH